MPFALIPYLNGMCAFPIYVCTVCFHKQERGASSSCRESTVLCKRTITIRHRNLFFYLQPMMTRHCCLECARSKFVHFLIGCNSRVECNDNRVVLPGSVSIRSDVHMDLLSAHNTA